MHQWECLPPRMHAAKHWRPGSPFAAQNEKNKSHLKFRADLKNYPIPTQRAHAKIKKFARFQARVKISNENEILERATHRGPIFLGSSRRRD